jgi:hypothetical protein
MRGEDCQIGNLFSYIDLEARVPKRHPLRLIRGIVNEVLEGLIPGCIDQYSCAHSLRPIDIILHG